MLRDRICYDFYYQGAKDDMSNLYMMVQIKKLVDLIKLLKEMLIPGVIL